MDANDVELTSSRPYRDDDEVYPGDELQENTIHKPVARQQNRFFTYGVLCFVLAIGVIFGAKTFIIPGEDAAAYEGSGVEQGTVGNNDVNAKVSEAVQNNQQTPPKKPHSSAYPNEIADAKPPALEEKETEVDHTSSESTSTTTSAADNLKAWHEIKVSKSDGQMYEVVDTLRHDAESFLEGLTYYNDILYESKGLTGRSALLVLDPNTGETKESYTMESKYFAEGLTYAQGKLYQLTYKAKRGFIYDVENLGEKPEEFDYETTTGEGWGFTYNEQRDEFIVSDGSAFLHFWDRKTLKQIRKHQIMRLDGKPARQINELEWWRDRVVANVWYEHVILIINPETGLVEKEYDFSTIWAAAGEKANQRAEVFNGISISSDPDILYVTGKRWAKMFKVKLLPEIPSQ